MQGRGPPPALSLLAWRCWRKKFHVLHCYWSWQVHVVHTVQRWTRTRGPHTGAAAGV
jgi:hypothetical protein